MIKAWGCVFGALLALSAGAAAPTPRSAAATSKVTASTAAANSAAAATSAAQQADHDFLIARDAFKAGDAFKLDRLAPALDSHRLAPYVRYWQLKLRIDDADPDAVRRFLTENRDSLLAERLRN